MKLRYSLKELDSAAKAFVEAINGRNMFAFYGQMGAGKTTLIKAICKELGVEEEVNSPTFAIVNEYEGRENPIYHFDFYRINKPEEALDFGLFDYFDSGNICLMEWPECIESLLPEEAVRVEIKVLDDDTRELTME